MRVDRTGTGEHSPVVGIQQQVGPVAGTCRGGVHQIAVAASDGEVAGDIQSTHVAKRHDGCATHACVTDNEGRWRCDAELSTVDAHAEEARPTSVVHIYLGTS